MNVIISALLLFFVNSVKSQYFDFPDVLIEALKPRGLRVSIPDEEGIQLFAFHGHINKKMKGREAGTFSVDIREPENGKWTFYTRGARLKVGDVLYYWIHVRYDNVGYEKDGQPFTVTELIDADGSSQSNTTGPSLPCQYGYTKFNGNPICKNVLIFEENFSTFDRKRWKPEIKFADNPEYEFVFYRDKPRNLYLEDNALHIQPIPTDEIYGRRGVYTKLQLNNTCTGSTPFECSISPQGYSILPPVTSAQVSTVDSFRFTYGVIEIKAKLPKGDWLYPQINLIPRGEVYGPDYASGRMIIAFLYGNKEFNYDLYAGCALDNWSNIQNKFTVKKHYSSVPWTDDFHVYRIEWNPDGIILKVDDITMGTIYPPSGGFASDESLLHVDSQVAERWKKGTVLAPFDQEMYIRLGVGVGGLVVFPDTISNKPWKNTNPKAQYRFYENSRIWKQTWDSNSKLVIDYVKVWSV